MNNQTKTYFEKITKGKFKTSQTKELKKAWLRKEHFVYYPQAEKCIDYLINKIDIISPYTPDIENIPFDQNATSIIGFSGCGKTMIYKELSKRIDDMQIDKSWNRFKLGYTICDDSITGLKGLYSTLFRPLGHPYGEKEIGANYKVSQLHESLVKLLYNSQYRVYAVDEFQHLGTISSPKQSVINQMKKIMLEASIPFIPIGTPKTISVLKEDTDEQLYNRCRPTKVTTFNYWKNDVNLKGFIKAYERFLPFSNPSDLVDYSDIIFNSIKITKVVSNDNDVKLCNLRNLVDFIKHCAFRAINKNAKNISEEDIRYNSELFEPVYDYDELMGF